ncbi:MAG: hypothetical protein OSB69_19170, partial [Alphaproteobacteria bacterium]|nr:hypothetical protein [Alphaproteobacteria bacterium]
SGFFWMTFLEPVYIGPRKTEDQWLSGKSLSVLLYCPGTPPGMDGQHCVTWRAVVFGEGPGFMAKFFKNCRPSIRGCAVAGTVAFFGRCDNGDFHEIVIE